MPTMFQEWKDHRKRHPSRIPPAEPKNTRVYSPDEVIEQFKFRLGGLDRVKFSRDVGGDFPKMAMTVSVGRHRRTFDFARRPHEAREIAEACALIFEGLRNSMGAGEKVA